MTWPKHDTKAPTKMLEGNATFRKNINTTTVSTATL